MGSSLQADVFQFFDSLVESTHISILR
jgi:hypothetical protein